MTAWASVELAVEAMQSGGRDFVQKPWDNEKLLSSLRRHIEDGRRLRKGLREKKREIEEAHEIQRRWLPAELPNLADCDVQAFWKPAKEIGGDYVDAIRLNGSAAAFCIADVAGKGLPAALLMSNMQASVRGLAHRTSTPDEMCRQLNRVALESTRADRFTTLFMRFSIRGADRCVIATQATCRRFSCVGMAQLRDCPKAVWCWVYFPTRSTMNP